MFPEVYSEEEVTFSTERNKMKKAKLHIKGNAQSNVSGHLFAISHGSLSLSTSHAEQLYSHNTLSVLSNDTSNQTAMLQHSVKRPLFTKLYNNGQSETPTLCTPSLLASIWNINPYKQPNQKRSVATQLSVVATEGVLVGPSSTEGIQTLKFAPCMPLCFCLPSNFVNCCRCLKGTEPVSLLAAVIKMYCLVNFLKCVY